MREEIIKINVKGTYCVDAGNISAIPLEVTGKTLAELEKKKMDGEANYKDDAKLFDIIHVKPGRYEVKIKVVDSWIGPQEEKGHLEVNEGIVIFGDFCYSVKGEVEHVSPSPSADNRSNYERLLERTSEGQWPREFCLTADTGGDGIVVASITLTRISSLKETNYIVITEGEKPCFVPTRWQAEDLRDCDKVLPSAIESNVGILTDKLAIETDKKKYVDAFHYLLDYWDSLPDEKKEEINQDLNKIFGEDHPEYVEAR